MVSFDLVVDKDDDILTERGLRKLLIKLVSCLPGSLIWLGVPCCSWVFLSRSVSKRSLFLPRGSTDSSAWVKDHNTIQTLATYLILTAHALQLQYVIEQPISSLLFAFDFRVKSTESLYHALLNTGASDVTVTMMAFNGSSQKLLRLRGTAPLLETMRQVSVIARPQVPIKHQTLAVKTISKDGRIQITGKGKELRESSAYTQEFGIAVALAYLGYDVDVIVPKKSK